MIDNGKKRLVFSSCFSLLTLVRKTIAKEERGQEKVYTEHNKPRSEVVSLIYFSKKACKTKNHHHFLQVPNSNSQLSFTYFPSPPIVSHHAFFPSDGCGNSLSSALRWSCRNDCIAEPPFFSSINH